MAFIRSFEERPLTPRGIHDDVVCGYRRVELEGRVILQLETYGSRNRVVLDTPSQKLQLDEAGARQLKKILDSSFPGI